MEFKELTTKSAGEIQTLLKELKEKAHNLSVKMKLGQIKNHRELGAVRKDIARVLTHLNSKKS